MTSWSSSKLRLLRVCGHAYAEDHVRHVPRPPHPALQGGGAAHAGLAMVVRTDMAGDPIDVRSIARHVCAGDAAEYADALEVLTLVQEELADDPPFVASRVIHLEERLEMPIGPHTFDGQADLVEADGRTCIVTDWKTHWRPLTLEAFKADPQLPRYALLLDHRHPGRFDRFRLRLRFVRYRGAVREYDLERYALDAVRWDLATEIEEAEAKVREGRFPATPGDWCTLCSRTDTCPKVTEFLAHGLELAITNDEEARRAAETMRAIDAHSGKIKRILKAYLGHDHPTGRVELAGGTYGYGPARHRKAAAADVLEVWEAHLQKPNAHVLRVDVDQLKRSLDRQPGTARRALLATIQEYDQADCRYRRGDNQEEASDP